MDTIKIEELRKELETDMGVSPEEFDSVYNHLKDEYGDNLHLMSQEEFKTRLLIIIEDWRDG